MTTRSAVSHSDLVYPPSTEFADITERGPFVPDIMQPGQFADLRRSTPYYPERALWMAVLEDALRCALGTGVSVHRGHYTLGPEGFRAWGARKKMIERDEAIAWFRDLRRVGPGTLTFICDLTGTDAARVSARVVAMATGQIEAPALPRKSPTLPGKNPAPLVQRQRTHHDRRYARRIG